MANTLNIPLDNVRSVLVTAVTNTILAVANGRPLTNMRRLGAPASTSAAAVLVQYDIVFQVQGDASSDTTTQAMDRTKEVLSSEKSAFLTYFVQTAISMGAGLPDGVNPTFGSLSVVDQTPTATPTKAPLQPPFTPTELTAIISVSAVAGSLLLVLGLSLAYVAYRRWKDKKTTTIMTEKGWPESAGFDGKKLQVPEDDGAYWWYEGPHSPSSPSNTKRLQLQPSSARKNPLPPRLIPATPRSGSPTLLLLKKRPPLFDQAVRDILTRQGQQRIAKLFKEGGSDQLDESPLQLQQESTRHEALRPEETSDKFDVKVDGKQTLQSSTGELDLAVPQHIEESMAPPVSIPPPRAFQLISKSNIDEIHPEDFKNKATRTTTGKVDNVEDEEERVLVPPIRSLSSKASVISPRNRNVAMLVTTPRNPLISTSTGLSAPQRRAAAALAAAAAAIPTNSAELETGEDHLPIPPIRSLSSAPISLVKKKRPPAPKAEPEPTIIRIAQPTDTSPTLLSTAASALEAAAALHVTHPDRRTALHTAVHSAMNAYEQKVQAAPLEAMIQRQLERSRASAQPSNNPHETAKRFIDSLENARK